MYIIKKSYLEEQIIFGIFSKDSFQSAFENYLRLCQDNRIWVGATYLYENINGKEILLSSFKTKEEKFTMLIAA